MERLEAALDKARQSRAEIKKTEPGAGPAANETAPVPDLWTSLREIKISNLAARTHRITTLHQNKLSSPYDLLRSRAMRVMRDNNWRTLAVTSPNTACGKTTVCANLAISLARQPDLRVMVIDLDLRRPNLHRVLSYRPNKSFHSVLDGTVKAEDQFVRLGSNLIFGLNNKAAPNPSEMLQSNKTKVRLNQIISQFDPDIVIYDMPPMLVSDDNVGFLPSVDTGLLVSAADSTTIAQLDSCEKELAELTNPLGVVLNKCRYASEDTGYDYEYY